MVSKAFYSPTPGKITISANTPMLTYFDGNNQYYIPSNDDFANIKDCGFNAVNINVGSLAYKTNTIEAFKYAAENGLVPIFSQGCSFEVLSTQWYPNNVLNLKDIGAFLLPDEPTYDSLINNSESLFRKSYEFLNLKNPNKTVFFNLAADTSEKWIGKNSSYESYLSEVQNIYSPSLWCLDIYPIYLKNGKISVRENFYNRLLDFQKISFLNQRPFFSYILCTEIQDMYPAPSIAYMRFAVFMALAMGAQGIIYWHYALRNSGTETYIDAPIDRNGKKTKIWNYVQSVNREIETYAFVFYGCQVQKIQISGLNNLNSKYIYLDCPLIKFIEVKEEGAYSGLLVSEIKNGNYNYIVIVSKNPFDSQDININFNNFDSTKYVWTPVTSNIKITNTSLIKEITIEAGSYAIIRWFVL